MEIKNLARILVFAGRVGSSLLQSLLQLQIEIPHSSIHDLLRDIDVLVHQVQICFG
jgi:hypothetical protein